MKALRRRLLGDERGGALVVVAISLVVLLGMAALAVDLTAAYAWRVEAQKIADSSALAGGSAFVDFPVLAEATPVADARAYDYALLHTIKNEAVDSSEVTVQVIPDSLKVRVQIARQGMPTWFASVLGFNGVDISAVAAAQAVQAGAAQCLKPIALPDVWWDADQDDGDGVWEDGEEWVFGSDEGDYYEPWDPSIDPTGLGPGTGPTGYGTPWRNDLGRQIQIKAADPQSEFNFTPGVFFPWRLPLDEDQPECDKAGGGTNEEGAATYRRNLCSCNNSTIDLGAPYEIQTGNMVGPTFQGVDELIDEDPNAYWDDAAGEIRGSDPDGDGITDFGLASPRVIKVAVFDPRQITSSGMQTITFNNFALLFLETQANPQAPVTARFLYYAGGQDAGGPTTGSLVRYLRLVE